ncbi:hypothetical protein THRCLA_08212 [Thraustotheca clavata]|uniref:UDENN domain-containing protein n=1 Tax=Thraustotheca clavata TaxID=74557 RepID=A0A1V9Z8A6_9STRA|nr:hypothetical protein THRCLA_08212 [Thraustotheca clavata]
MASTWHDHDRWEEAKREKAQALREATAWKKKYIAERERRRELIRSLVVILRQEHAKPLQNDALIRRFSSILSNPDETSALLSPTLPSFDLDGDEDDSTEDEELRAGKQLASVPPSLQLVLEEEKIPTRSLRSSTVDSFPLNLSPRHDPKEEGQNMMINMLYSRSFVDDGHRSKRLQNLAKSISCFRSKRDRIFEHFFISGVPSSATIEPALDDVEGYWKPKVLFQYPPSAVYPMNEQAVSAFCFPIGTPAFSCTLSDVEAIKGSLVSSWACDTVNAYRQLLESYNTQCYTFRLTGSKGEALYGFCAAVMMDIEEPPILLEKGCFDGIETDSESDCDHGRRKKKREPPPFHSLAGILASPLTEKDSAFFEQSPAILTPRSYCITSKYPFYKLHFYFLRMLIESDMKARSAVKHSMMSQHTKEFEVVITSPEPLTMSFQMKDNVGANSWESVSEKQSKLLDAIASPITRTNDDFICISDERRFHPSSPKEDVSPIKSLRRKMRRSSSWSTSPSKLPGSKHERKKSSAVVATLDPAITGIRVGDILTAINGFPTGLHLSFCNDNNYFIADLAFAESMHLLDTSKRPLKLKFRRLFPKVPRRTSSFAHLEKAQTSSKGSTVLELLRRYRSMKLDEPGSWTTLKLDQMNLKYQFPVERTDEWTVKVLLELLSPENIVTILGHLLLEKQVAVVSDSTAKLSAVNTALLVLLRPYQWQSTYIPVLPSNLLDFLHSPVPYLVGIHPLFTPAEWPDVCFVYLDSGTITSPFPALDNESIPSGSQMTQVLYSCKEKWNTLPQQLPHPWYELSDAENDIISLVVSKVECILSTICGDIRSLSLVPLQGKSSYDVLQEEFLNANLSSNYIEFLSEFAQTQLFCQYCEDVLHILSQTRED